MVAVGKAHSFKVFAKILLNLGLQIWFVHKFFFRDSNGNPYFKITRWELYTGKFFGTLLAAIINVLIMLGILSGLLYLKFGVLWTGFQWVALFMLLEFAIMTGMVLLFSLTNSLILCFSLSIFCALLGNMAEHVKHLAFEADIPMLSFLTDVVYWLVPNFGYFNIKYKILKDLAISPSFAFWAIGYACCYLVFLLIAGSWALNKKDL